MGNFPIYIANYFVQTRTIRMSLLNVTRRSSFAVAFAASKYLPLNSAIVDSACRFRAKQAKSGIGDCRQTIAKMGAHVHWSIADHRSVAPRPCNAAADFSCEFLRAGTASSRPYAPA
jgi:hypothetical protein